MDNEFDVYIRPLSVEDAMTSYRWRNNPEVWKNTGSAPNVYVTPEMETEWIKKALENPRMRRYAICLKKNNQYIGNVYLGEFNGRSASEQIFIGETALWGKGIGTRARELLYEMAKSEFGLTRIETHIRPRNIASMKSALKLGFQEFDRDDEWVKLEKYL